MSYKASLIKLIIFIIVTLFLTLTLAQTIGNISFDAESSYKARFTDATGIFGGNDVRIAGVKVGTVTGVKLVDKKYADVSFKVKKNVKLYTTTKARIRYLNLIGGRFLALDDAVTNTPLYSFFAFNPTFNGGVFVSAGDVNGDGQADIMVGLGAQSGTDSRVRVFNGINSGMLFDFVPFTTFRGGVRVAADDLDGDGKADLLVATGAGKSSVVLGLKGTDLSSLLTFNPYDPSFLGGVYVG